MKASAASSTRLSSSASLRGNGDAISRDNYDHLIFIKVVLIVTFVVEVEREVEIGGVNVLNSYRYAMEERSGNLSRHDDTFTNLSLTGENCLRLLSLSLKDFERIVMSTVEEICTARLRSNA
ncbi:hypothetical protein HAX54_041625, partial [Datura stramonium]|nr:hypothetical protein [Datura stramonium]